MKPVVISLTQVDKAFATRPNNLKNLFQPKPKTSVLQNVSLNIRQGQTIGLYGPNGSGKSTLLRLISGIIKPDRGTVQTQGTIGPVLELGAALHPDLSGTDNINLYAATLGFGPLSQSEQTRICRFASLENHIHRPVKFYSTGMKARLAFSVVIHTNPDILLLDEVLSVGDEDFGYKCHQKIAARQGKQTTVIASHNLNQLIQSCDVILALSPDDNSPIANRKIHLISPDFKNFLLASLDQHSLTLNTNSSSMHPTIKKGEKITIQKTKFSNIKIGDIIAISFPNLPYFIIHRAIAKTRYHNGNYFLTKGDANPSIDSWLIGPKELIGKIINQKTVQI